MRIGERIKYLRQIFEILVHFYAKKLNKTNKFDY